MTIKNDAQQLHYQRLLLDEITTTLAYTKSMVAVAIGSDFNQYEIPVMHDYLGGVHSLLDKMDELQQQLTRTFYAVPMVGAEKEDVASVMSEKEEI